MITQACGASEQGKEVVDMADKGLEEAKKGQAPKYMHRKLWTQEDDM
jgi:hypothetical protein